MEVEGHKAGWQGACLSYRNLNILAQESASQDPENHISIMVIGWWAGGSVELSGWGGDARLRK